MRKTRKFVAALLVMSMLLALTVTAFAYNDKPVSKYVLFKGSAYGYTKIWNDYGHKKDLSTVVLRKGSIAHVVAEKGSWYKIEIPRKVDGTVELLYFKKDFTKAAPCETTALVYSTAGARKGSGKGVTLDGDAAIKGIKIKTSGATELYKYVDNGAYGKLKKIQNVKKGKLVVLTKNIARDERGSTYFEVKLGGKKGYIPANRLDRTGVYKIMKLLGIND